ncbi:hypothetical protein LV78_004263 [Actinosynnema pretiosum]|nr:hypothetical protein [Actinosynnema pretiosum]
MALRAELGPDDLVHLAPELSTGVVVEQKVGGQTLTIALGYGIPGWGMHLEVPASFRITEVRHDERELWLVAADGRVAHGTPLQFDQPAMVEAEFNPRYEEECVELLMSTHLREESDYSRREVGGRTVFVQFDSMDPARQRELESHLVGLLARWGELERGALEFVCREMPDEPGELERFVAAFEARAVTVYRSGDFQVQLNEIEEGEYLLDNYWYTVVHLADGTPVDSYVDA